MAVVGGGEFPKTFRVPKSVWVFSSEVGPRSLERVGGLAAFLRGKIVENERREMVG